MIDAESMTMVQIVASQLEAYNRRDIDAFMDAWCDDAEMFAWPSTCLARGASEIRIRHIDRFQEADLRAHLLSRVAVGGLVIDREVLTRNFPEGRGELDVIAIYEVKGNKIKRAWFKQGSPRLAACP